LNGVPLVYTVEEDGIHAAFAADTAGEKTVRFSVNGRDGKAVFYISPPYEDLIRTRIDFILTHQQCLDERSPLYGAYLIYDNEEKRQYFHYDRLDWNANRERMGMALTVLKWLQSHEDAHVSESLSLFTAFLLSVVRLMRIRPQSVNNLRTVRVRGNGIGKKAHRRRLAGMRRHRNENRVRRHNDSETSSRLGNGFCVSILHTVRQTAKIVCTVLAERGNREARLAVNPLMIDADIVVAEADVIPAGLIAVLNRLAAVAVDWVLYAVYTSSGQKFGSITILVI
jgi:hypothetical protein